MSRVRLWKVPDFIEVSYQESLLENIRQVLAPLRSQKQIDTISEETSPLLHYGSFFAPSNYNKSQRTILAGTDVEMYLPEIKRMYYHDMSSVISELIGTNVYPVDVRGGTGLQVLIYDNVGDSIGAHFDTSYFREDQKVVTALLCLENKSSQQLCVHPSTDIIRAKKKKRASEPMLLFEEFPSSTSEEELKCLDMKDRDLYVFEHYTFRHAIRPEIKAGESRIVVTMVFAEYPYSDTMSQYIWEKFKSLSNYNNLQKTLLPPDRVIVILLSLVLALFLIVLVVVLVLIFSKNSSGKCPRS